MRTTDEANRSSEYERVQQPHAQEVRAFPVNRPRNAEPVASFASFIGRDYAAAISRVALIGSFSTLQSALKFASRGRT